MNCFAHALPFLDNPYMAVGACMPDWLSAFDRKCRARERLATPFMEDEDPITASVARGVVQHHKDDFWFHQSTAFVDLNMKFALEIRERLGGEAGFRPSLFGHIVIELMLDGYLHDTFPGKLELFYDKVASVDVENVQTIVNRFTTKPTEGLPRFMKKFHEERYLFDYVDNDRLMFRMNNILKRVKLAPVNSELDSWLSTARQEVYDHSADLFEQYSMKVTV